MLQLRPAALSRLAAETRVPRYDRAGLAIGMAHIGVGAFHRCHQAEYTDDMLEAAFGPWGVIGINIRPPRLADSLGAQDGLYSRTLMSGSTADCRVIGCIKRVLDVESGASTKAAIATLAASEIATITLTLTEKGYCHIPASGRLDPSNPNLARDLAFPSEPRLACWRLPLSAGV